MKKVPNLIAKFMRLFLNKQVDAVGHLHVLLGSGSINSSQEADATSRLR